jgi:hypothetical protein
LSGVVRRWGETILAPVAARRNISSVMAVFLKAAFFRTRLFE